VELTGVMDTARDAEAFLQLDREFHFLTYSGALTIVLCGTLERLWNRTQGCRHADTFLAWPCSNSNHGVT
jgi:DNA-binding GntR family transcriptional regulator